jgi:flagellar operon protein
MNRLEAAVEKAGLKGGKESLILLDDLAFVVSVKNRTVITAVGADRMADNVFTNIDSVVIARDSA